MRRNIRHTISSQCQWLPHVCMRVPSASFRESRRSLSTLSREEEEDQLVRQLIQQSDLGDYGAPISAPSLRPSMVEPPVETLPSTTAAPPGNKGGAAVHDDAAGSTAPASSATATPPASGATPQVLNFLSVRRPKSGILEWQCIKCSTYNRLSTSSCRTCGMPASASYRTAQPMPARHVATMPSEWYCNVGTCRHLNRTPSMESRKLSPRMQRERYVCAGCAQPFHGVHDWLCSTCSSPNARAAAQCTSCFASRAVGWKCTACDETRNSIFSMSCASCNKLREPSREHEGAIVHCTSCKAMNQSNWEVCTVCVAPLPPLLSAIDIKEVVPVTSVRYLDPTRRTLLTHLAASGASTMPLGPPKEEPSPTTALPIVGPPVDDASSSFGLPPTWTCKGCGAVHRMRVPFCDNCLAGRTDSMQKPLTSAVKPPTELTTRTAGNSSEQQGTTKTPRESQGSWTCHVCATKNSPFGKSCVQCREPRKLPSGYWQCLTCYSVNRRARLMCIGCCDLQPQLGSAIVMPETKVVKWTCNKCAFDSNPALSNRCQNCGVDRVSWQCRCGHVNALSLSNCASCNVSRDTGGYSCGACHAINPLGSERCDKCGYNLQTDTRWTCANCGCDENDLLVSGACIRCNSVNKVHHDNKGLWLCPTCRSPNVAQDSRLGTCRYCETPQSADRKTFPLRWVCEGCGNSSLISSESCRDCNARRSINWDFVVDCPTCHKSTVVDAKEACVHCNRSLTTLVSSLFKKVVVDDEEIAHYKLADAKQAPPALDVAIAKPTVPIQLQNAGNQATALAWACSLCGSRNEACHAECESCGMPKDL